MLVPMTPELGELHRRELLAEAERRRLARALDRDRSLCWAVRRTLGGALIRADCWLARVPAEQTVPASLSPVEL